MTLTQMFQSYMPQISIQTADDVRQKTSDAMVSIVEDFQKTRAQDFYELAQKSGERGAQLAKCQRELDQWRSYARELEKKCMQCGCELPLAPDEI